MKNTYKLYIFLILLVVQSSEVKSQQGTINYKLTNNDKILRQKREESLIIYFDKLNSIELIIKPKNNISEDNTNELNQIKVIKTKPYFIYKDFSAKKLLLSDYVGTRKMQITDTLNNFKWRVSDERKKIGNFNCKKAETTFRGRSYEAWYTEDVPLRNGPWKFCGLPGLIVMIKDAKSDFVYELTGINLKAKFDNKIISVPAAYEKDKTITYKEFRTLYKKKLDDYIRLSRVEQTTPDGISAKINIRLPEKQEKF